jgi:tetratricopeptide (TPR) repeat protein
LAGGGTVWEVFLLLFNEVKKSHYETLGLAKSAGDEEIKRAYFGLVRKYQPDRFPEEFKEIRAAYETLRDREKRAEYDAVDNLPLSAAPLFHEARRLDRLGRYNKSAELYREILKSHPGLDSVREQYARSLSDNDKTGKAAEVWEELCRKHPGNSRYARELGRCYSDRGWNKKALAEARRGLALERDSIDGWLLLLSCVIEGAKNSPGFWDEVKAVSLEALEAVKAVKTNEWEKIQLCTYVFITNGIRNKESARVYLREIIRLIREGGRNGRDEGRQALKEIFRFVPDGRMADFYSEFKEIEALLLDGVDEWMREKIDSIRLSVDIENLEKIGFSDVFRDLFRILNAGFEEDEDELEVTAMEYAILDDKSLYAPQLRRLREEFPELYALHSSFFNEALRTRDPDKMLYQRMKKYKRLKREIGNDGEPEAEPEPEAPETARRAQPKVGRNDPCPCGSGKKYKRCCGA